jgi:hypothetical protein
LLKEFFDFLKNIFFGVISPICKIVSYPHFPKLFSVFSIFLISLRICAQFITSVGFLKSYLDFFVYITLIFSILGLLYQTQKIDISIYPPKIHLTDLEEFNCYGVKDLRENEERDIEILSSKEGFFKIFLHSIQIDYPSIGKLQILQTSFWSNDVEETRRGVIEDFQNGQEKIIDQTIEGFGAIICKFRIYDKEKYYPMTTSKITIKFSYRVLGFLMYNEKSVIINP